MELRQLIIFRELATQLNFTRTAAALNYAQSNITTQIQALETRLGATLFERFGRRVALTDAGQRLLPYADQILRLAEAARSEVSMVSGPAGLLTVGAAETVLAYRMPPVVQAFQERYPRVDLRFQPISCSQLCQKLIQGEIHVGFLLESPAEPASLVVEPLADEPLALITRAGHPWTARPQVEVEDLRAETLLLTEPGCSYRDKLEQAMSKVPISPQRSVQFTNLEAIKQCVMMGVGVALLPRIAVRAEIERGRLAQVPLNLADLHVTTYLAWNKDRYHSPALSAFLTVARSVMAVRN